MESSRILRTYVTLTLLATLASSFIWGINTPFFMWWTEGRAARSRRPAAREDPQLPTCHAP